jgi:CRISPR-associated endonuclease/helicase Cas3
LLAGRFAAAWGASETAALAALWHDLGKYAAEFQAMIAASDA